jgi:hypothetical protein
LISDATGAAVSREFAGKEKGEAAKKAASQSSVTNHL